MAENVKTPNRPKAGTRLRNFIGSGGKVSDFKSCKGLDKVKGKK